LILWCGREKRIAGISFEVRIGYVQSPFEIQLTYGALEFYIEDQTATKGEKSCLQSMP